MIHRISMMKPIHLLLILALVIMVPIIAQDEDTAAVQDEVILHLLCDPKARQIQLQYVHPIKEYYLLHLSFSGHQ